MDRELALITVHQGRRLVGVQTTSNGIYIAINNKLKQLTRFIDSRSSVFLVTNIHSLPYRPEAVVIDSQFCSNSWVFGWTVITIIKRNGNWRIPINKLS